MIIDCHGHYTTEPKDLHRFRKEQTAAANAKDKAAMPPRAALKMPDDEIRESIEGNQLKLQRERGTDLTIFSPRASGMGHHVGDESVSQEWSEICNDLIARVWPRAVVEEATLRVHIAALRRHLREGAEGQRFIVNVPGRGYSFVAPVVRVRPVSVPVGPDHPASTPLPVGRLVGRDRAVAALTEKIRLRRFVTLVGPGGVGKSAVAWHVAAALAPVAMSSSSGASASQRALPGSIAVSSSASGRRSTRAGGRRDRYWTQVS